MPVAADDVGAGAFACNSAGSSKAVVPRPAAVPLSRSRRVIVFMAGSGDCGSAHLSTRTGSWAAGECREPAQESGNGVALLRPPAAGLTTRRTEVQPMADGC